MPVVGTGQFSPDARYLATVGFGAATTFIRIDRDADADGVFDEAGASTAVRPAIDPRGTATRPRPMPRRAWWS